VVNTRIHLDDYGFADCSANTHDHVAMSDSNAPLHTFLRKALLSNPESTIRSGDIRDSHLTGSFVGEPSCIVDWSLACTTVNARNIAQPNFIPIGWHRVGERVE